MEEQYILEYKVEEQSRRRYTQVHGGGANGSSGAGQSEDEGSKVEEEGSTPAVSQVFCICICMCICICTCILYLMMKAVKWSRRDQPTPASTKYPCQPSILYLYLYQRMNAGRDLQILHMLF